MALPLRERPRLEHRSGALYGSLLKRIGQRRVIVGKGTGGGRKISIASSHTMMTVVMDIH